MNIENQPARGKNISAIVSYFESGIKYKAEAIGIELEHTLVKDNGEPLSYNDEFGQLWILEQLSSNYDDVIRSDDGSLIGLINERNTVTLEPAAQLELSAGPFTDLNGAKFCMTCFQEKLDHLVSGHGISMLTPGYHPTRRAVDLKLIPKKRYEFMNEYLGSISMFGICMMRGSAATQVSIDYSSVDDCLRKMRLANACVPIFSLICDNSPVFEGEERTHQMMRTEIWEKCDPARCNTVPGVMDDDFNLESYAAYILDTPAIVDISQGEAQLSERTFGEIYAKKEMGLRDVEHALSMFFTDVRLKKYIEIRPADAMPVDCAVGYAALVKGLFYNAGSLNAMDAMFQGIGADDIADAKTSLMKDGYDAKVYGHPVTEIADELISLAKTGLPTNEVALLAPISELVSARKTLAEIALEG